MLEHKLYEALDSLGKDLAEVDSVMALELMESGLTADEAINLTVRPTVSYIDGVAYTNDDNSTVLEYVALFNELGYYLASDWLQSRGGSLENFNHYDESAVHDAVILP